MPATLDPAGAVTVCPPEAFVGREALIEEARAILDADASDRDNAVGVLLHGPPGIGASSAAARIAEALEEHTPVVVVGALSEAALLRALAEADRRRPDLLAPGSEPGTLRERLERLLGGPLARAPLLFVFDEFDANLSAESRPVEEAATILTDLADTIRTTESGSRLLVTSHSAFGAEPAGTLEPLALPGLEDEALAAKLETLPNLGAQSNGEATLRAKAIAVAEGNPGLLELLEAALTAEAGELIDALAETEAAARRDALIAALLARQAEPDSALLRVLSLLEAAVDEEALSEIADTAAPAPLAALESAGLVERHAPNGGEVRSRLTRPVRRALDAPLDEAARALAAHALQVLYRRWWTEADSASGGQLDDLRRLAAISDDPAISAELTAAVASGWVMQGRFGEARRLCETALTGGEDYRLLHQLARALAVFSPQQASEHYERSLELCPENDPGERGAILHDLAVSLDLQGHVENARASYEQSIAASTQAGNAAARATTLQQLAGLLTRSGELDEARQRYEQALDLRQELGDGKGTADTLQQIAGLEARRGDADQAFNLYQQALALRDEIGDLPGKAATLHQLADLRAREGVVELARSLYRQAIELREEIGDPRGKAAALQQLAVLEAQQADDPVGALALHEEALAIREASGDLRGIATSLRHLAALQAKQGDLPAARKRFEKLAALHESMGDAVGRGAALANISALTHREGHTDRARELGQEAATILGGAGALGDLFAVLNNLGAGGDQSALVQSAWLSLYLNLPASQAINTLATLQQELGDRHPLAAALAAMVLLLADTRGANEPEQEQMHNFGTTMLQATALARGVDGDDVQAWFEEEQLNEPQFLLRELDKGLVSLHREAWYFDRDAVKHRGAASQG